MKEKLEANSSPKSAIPEPLPAAPTTATNLDSAATAADKTVFISYNHKDKEKVNQIRSQLENPDIDIKVKIDSESMDPGESIKSFIESAIRETDVTLSIVSKNSLLSAWVAMETTNTISAEIYRDKKFIPCYIDPCFLERGFTTDAIKQTLNEIILINQEMQDSSESD